MQDVLREYQHRIESLRNDALFDDRLENIPEGQVSAQFLLSLAYLEVAEASMRIAKENL